MYRLMIVDDQDIVRQGLTAMLETDKNISVSYQASNGKEAIELLEKNHIVDVVMLDIRMPEMNGLEATRIIKQRWPNIKVFILTTFNDEAYATETLTDGASGFLLKTADAKKLIEAVYSVMEDGMPIHEEVAAKVIPNLLKRQESSTTPDVELTKRETAIVQLVGEGRTNQEIANTLYLSVGTVKNYISTILQKLDCRDRTQLAILAVKYYIE